MAKAPKSSSVSNAQRLLRAVETAQGTSKAIPAVARALAAPPAAVLGAPPKRAKLGGQVVEKIVRQVRFPKNTGALRQHVAEIQDRKAALSPIRVQLRAPSSLDPAVDGRTSPSSVLRERVDAARRTIGQQAEVGTSAAQAVRLSSTTAVDFGRQIRERRESLRMSQAQLAAKAGTGRRFISELERGKSSVELGRALVVLGVLGLRFVVAAIDG